MRFSERDDITLPHNFLPRKRNGSIWQVLIGFAVAIAIMLSLNLIPSLVGGEPEASLISLVTIAGLCFYIVYLKQANLDLVLHTEFQNLLFSQGAAAGTLFCAFAKRDGVLMYISPSFFDRFDVHDRNRITTLSSMLHAMHATESMHEILGNHVFSLHEATLNLTLTKAHQGLRQLTLEIFPLSRPSGYVLLRALPVYANTEDAADHG